MTTISDDLVVASTLTRPRFCITGLRRLSTAISGLERRTVTITATWRTCEGSA